MASFSYNCPWCNHDSTVANDNYSTETHGFFDKIRSVHMSLWTEVTICPNPKCRQVAINASLSRAKNPTPDNMRTSVTLKSWNLLPQSSAKTFPDYIPKPIRDDYEEACAIKDLSPKASATLSRRCLQGIIRDFWGVKGGSLFAEVNQLSGKIDLETWDAIDAVRKIGNIGAHMEKDINLVVDVDPEEASLLIGLIETLLEDWYIAKEKRKNHLQKIIAVSVAKATKRKVAKKAPTTKKVAAKKPAN